jgi:hypothetical protein
VNIEVKISKKCLNDLFSLINSSWFSGWFMVFNATFNKISVISEKSYLNIIPSKNDIVYFDKFCLDTIPKYNSF